MLNFISKKTYFLLLFTFLSSSAAFAQTDEIAVRGITMTSIQSMIADEEGVYYYPNLVKQFVEDPKAMQNIDFLMLYYGYVFTDEYDPYAHFGLEDSLSSLLDKEKFKEATDLADSLLAMNPVSIFGNIQKGIALSALGNDEASTRYLERYRILVETIQTSGIGSSYESPIVLITEKDAQAILLRYQLTELSKSLNGKGSRYYDVYVVRNQEEKEYPIYFDVTLPRQIGMAKLKKTMSGNGEAP